MDVDTTRNMYIRFHWLGIDGRGVSLGAYIYTRGFHFGACRLAGGFSSSNSIAFFSSCQRRACVRAHHCPNLMYREALC